MRTYVFVDAENHFLRSQHFAANLIGSPFALEAIGRAKMYFGADAYFPRSGINGARLAHDRELQLFWDCDLLRLLSSFGEVRGGEIHRAIHVASCVGDENKAHAMRRQIREIGFEPIVISEPKSLFAERQNSLEKFQIIEKPKGCDVALATRMVADAAADLYERCCVFTSDADFLPRSRRFDEWGKLFASQASDMRYLSGRHTTIRPICSLILVNISSAFGRVSKTRSRKC